MVSYKNFLKIVIQKNFYFKYIIIFKLISYTVWKQENNLFVAIKNNYESRELLYINIFNIP